MSGLVPFLLGAWAFGLPAGLLLGGLLGSRLSGSAEAAAYDRGVRTAVEHMAVQVRRNGSNGSSRHATAEARPDDHDDSDAEIGH